MTIYRLDQGLTSDSSLVKSRPMPVSVGSVEHRMVFVFNFSGEKFHDT